MSLTKQALPIGDLWMELRDRKKLQRLMVVQDVSQRELAAAAGWKAHSYVSRICRGEIKNISPEPALRIAKFLGVGVEDLFLTKVEEVPVQPVRTGSPEVKNEHARRFAAAHPVRRK
ncbi:helix-turn-helix transcriptional regulator [Arthrobacter sp. MP_2.3]|uniref:helix-turn-helix transcriptional regulator n=1 Tax=Arthrobacter sp. MP_2.3 TaxID=3349633 RepID=UPI0038D4D3E3